MKKLPVLYSFRRCPYAIRARMALAQSALRCELREVKLANKPAEMLALSAKGTVPVLQLCDGRILDESFEIMCWALSQSDPAGWLEGDLDEYRQLVWANDEQFKPCLDRYKYFTRYPEHSRDHYLAQATVWLETLEARLQGQAYLCGHRPRIADIALFPFIRQFARSDLRWFEACAYRRLRDWMTALEQAESFTSVMNKYPLWEAGQPGVLFAGSGRDPIQPFSQGLQSTGPCSTG